MRKIFYLTLILVAISCDTSILYKETITSFPENRWAQPDVKEFGFNLNEDAEAGVLSLYFSHVFEPQYVLIPVTIIVEYPSGEKERIYMDINLKDNMAEDLSDCVGDICDIEIIVKELQLPKGNYKITVQNRFSHAYVPNVLALGIRIKTDT